MPLRAIFFDAGNTLLYPRVDELAQELTAAEFPATVEDFYVAEREAKRKLDAWLWPRLGTTELPAQADRMYWVEYLRALLERLKVPADRHAALTEQLAERFRDIRFWSRVFPDTEPVLQSLEASGYTLGVISNSVGTIADQLGRAGLGRYFRFILDSAVVGVEKPNPAIFNMALDQAGVPAGDALFIGDTYAIDVGGAGQVGIRAVLIDRFGCYDDSVGCRRLTTLGQLTEFVRAS
jgi:putative hydrolase of the HAD superfamily